MSGDCGVHPRDFRISKFNSKMMLRGRSTLPAHREEDLLRHSSAEDVVVAANGLVPELRDVVRRERGPSIGAERPLGEDNSGSSGALYRSIVPALSESGEEFVTPVTLIVPELRPQAIAEDEVDDVPVVSLALEPRFIPRQHTSVEQAKERATLAAAGSVASLSTRPSKREHEPIFASSFSIASRSILSRGRRVPKPDSPEVAKKKEELSRVVAELESARTDHAQQMEANQRRKEALESKRDQLEERKRSFGPFLEENQRKLSRSNTKCDRETALRLEKEREAREIEFRLSTLSSRTATLKAMQGRTYAAYGAPLRAALPLLFASKSHGTSNEEPTAGNASKASIVERKDSSATVMADREATGTFTLHAASGDEPDIEDIVHAFKDLDRRGTDLRLQSSLLSANARQLERAIDSLIQESDRDRGDHASRSSALAAQREDLAARLKEQDVRQMADRRRYWELRKNVVELQEIAFRFLVQAEDVIARRAAKYLGPDRILDVAAGVVGGDETLETVDSPEAVQLMRQKDQTATKLLRGDLEAFMRVSGELSILLSQSKSLTTANRLRRSRH